MQQSIDSIEQILEKNKVPSVPTKNLKVILASGKKGRHKIRTTNRATKKARLDNFSYS